MRKLKWLTFLKRRITLNITAPTDADSDLLSLVIPPDTTVSTLKQSVQAESRIPATSQHLYHNGQLLNDDAKTMEQLQIGDGEMLALHVRDMVGSTGVAAGQHRAQPARQQPRSGQENDPETIRLQLLGNPQWRQQVMGTRPELGAAVENPERFAQIYRQMQEQEREEHARRQQAISDLNSDPFDADAQRRIEEMIREERVQENLQNAIEHNPEGGQSHIGMFDGHTNTLQSLAEFTCCILTSKSMVTRLKHSLTQVPKPRSCLLLVLKLAVL
ncbi:uncharacterized protein LY89DRAFT_414249 [Mollisia scopiformis]|uniref:Ubiquitin-like domain-containing protein n=1 Tax=Mollisia scopiformis TaxID=149040 RepID=A0A132B3M0_MOLSC|nr:uncharacterized protein LY89DRAFT_414249 [Mollisia scopiformis]KUJ06267.1 hypothetical protein LY89DRAFT_414249 [Mollisia scopiformis]